MPDAIPSVLVPYVQDCLASARLTFLGSTLSTPANWLVIRFVYAAIQAKQNPSSAPYPGKQHNATSKAVLVSLLRPTDLWVELGKKIGLDVVGLCNAGKLQYIDGLSQLKVAAARSPMPVTSFKSLHLADVATTIKSVTNSNFNGLIILDGLDFLCASQPDIGVLQLQDFLSTVRELSQAVVLTCSTDTPLLHNRHEGATSLERDHAALLSTVAHQSSWIFQSRGLDTGTARDITGVLRISCGPDYADEVDETRGLDDGEWLYQIKGDGGVEMWTRGE